MDFSDNPFFWSRRSVRPTAFRGFPSYSPEPRFQSRNQPVSATVPKVVQIPVHYVGSEPSTASQSRSASALKIQKVFRGFLVRRSMKRIIAIRRDVSEIERRISQSETLEMIRRDERERLRVNEMLMALLLKLDSVHGVDSAVRDCRRAVAKKAIALQERVDAIVSAVDQSQVQILGESEDDRQQNADPLVAQTLETTATDGQTPVEFSGQIEESDVVNFDNGSQGSPEGKDAGQGDTSGDVPNSDNSVAENGERVEAGNRTQESADGICQVKESGDRSDMNVEDENCVDDEVDNFVTVEADSGARSKEEEHCLENGTGKSCHNVPAADECLEEGLETSQMQTLTERVEVNHVEGMREEEKGKTEDNERNQGLLKRIIEDNQKVMNMLSQLCERNETQMRMLNSLTWRVEQLEAAYVRHILKRKKGRFSD